MSSNLNFIDVNNFLAKVGLSLIDYFDLSNVPFPLVTRTGQVVYFYDDEFFLSNRSTDRPTSESKCSISLEDIYSSCYIDTRSFSKIENNKITSDYIFRNDNIHIDYSRFTKESHDVFRAETAADRTSIYIDPETGLERVSSKPCALLCGNSYNFSDLDLVNCRNEEFLSLFYSADYSVVYDNKTESFKFTLNESKGIAMPNTPIKSTEVTSTIVDANKNAIVIATKLEVGGLALDLLAEQIAKTLPEPFKQLAETNPLFKIAIANIINLFVVQTNINDPKLAALNDAMMTKSYTEMLGKFDFTSILSGVLAGLPAGKLETLTKA